MLEWPNNVFFYGDLDDIALDNPTIDRWFNTDAGETYANPNLNPTSTQFGRITANNGTYMRFVTFVTKFNF